MRNDAAARSRFGLIDGATTGDVFASVGQHLMNVVGMGTVAPISSGSASAAYRALCRFIA